MNFAYTIDYQNRQNRTITVVYTPEHPAALATVSVLHYDEDATAQDIETMILANAPLEAWQSAIDNAETGIVLTSGTAIPATQAAVEAARAALQPPALTLDQVKAELCAQIDADAGRERAAYITVAPGQEMTYMEKRAEAVAYVEAADPDPADYPLLSAEAAATGQTIAAVAAIVIAQYEAWRVIGSAIEGVRMGGKATVNAAVDLAGAQAAYDAIEWPSAP